MSKTGIFEAKKKRTGRKAKKHKKDMRNAYRELMNNPAKILWSVNNE